MKTLVLRVELTREEDGRWSATCPALPGCATWAHTQEEVLRYIREAAEAYVADMMQAGEPLPKEATVIDAPAVSVTV